MIVLPLCSETAKDAPSRLRRSRNSCWRNQTFSPEASFPMTTAKATKANVLALVLTDRFLRGLDAGRIG
jgi:hypothetical protein